MTDVLILDVIDAVSYVLHQIFITADVSHDCLVIPLQCLMSIPPVHCAVLEEGLLHHWALELQLNLIGPVKFMLDKKMV